MPQESPAFNTASTIDASDVARFTAIASEWWDERGKFAPLHRLNPARIEYIRDHVAQHFGRPNDPTSPLKGLRLLDVGCGGGLISEPMARLGAQVTGIDAGEENIQVAITHAQASGLTIDYRCTTAEALASDTQFDVVLALEIIEHVANPSLFYDALAALVKPGGLLILSTLNRTAKSYLMAIIGAEVVLRWLPRGTHDWNRFIKPSEMATELIRRRFILVDTSGLVFNPLRQKFHINSNDLDVNYLMVAKR